MIHLILIPYSTFSTSKYDIGNFNQLNLTNLTSFCDNFDSDIKTPVNDDCLDKSPFIQSPLLINLVFTTILLIQ